MSRDSHGLRLPDSTNEERLDPLNYKGNNRYFSQPSSSEDTIRKEASSQAINKTIRMIEQRLDIEIPRVGTPTENREEMIKTLSGMLGP